MTDQASDVNRTTSPTSRVPTRIAFCVTDLDAGGAEKALLRLVTGLDRTRWEPIAYCLGPEAELVQPLRAAGITVNCYGARSWQDLGVFSWLTQQLRESRPKLLQCFLFHGNLVGRIAGKCAGVPVIVAGHRVAEHQKRWHLWLEKWTGRFVDHHVCVSRGVEAFIQRNLGVRAEETSVIANGVDPVSPLDPEALEGARLWVSREFGFPEDARIVLSVGRLHPQKNFSFLLRAFQEVSQKIPSARLLIVGEGPERASLDEEVQELELSKVVRMPGRRADVLDLMRGVRAYACSSRWEGMSNAMMEAMASGLPVISTEVEGTDELIPDEGVGIVVTQGDQRGFAAVLARVLTDDVFADQLGLFSQRFVGSQFAWERMVAEYDSLYQRLIF